MSSPHSNRLAGESSPYLLQHASNPVDWYPWGAEAFAAAHERDAPIFLSVGYATCHWCHVMERESFEDVEVAALLREHFVSVKVDREERPDVDGVYMHAVMAMTGRGGWPMSVFLTPDGAPFWGGTYFPPHDRHGMPGFKTVLHQLAASWKNRRADILASSERLTGALQPRPLSGEGEIQRAALDESVAAFKTEFDEGFGGFGSAPKFPRSHGLSFMLGQWRRTRDADSLAAAETTLDAMYQGGIYDHLGGGFHRYSTDRHWLVPHFEKMLYDQALLAISYLEAYQITGRSQHADVTRDILRYVLRDLRDPAGGFYSAEDADSEGVEGKFYVWSDAEIREHLGADDADLFCRVYGVLPDGNFTDEATGQACQENILHLTGAIDDLASEIGMDGDELEARLAPMRQQLFEVREGRVHPFKDDKILTDWNGLMLSCLSRAGRVLGETAFLDAARACAGFLLDNMCAEPQGRLLHRHREGESGILAYLDDHAFLALGLLDLYEATFEPRWLQESRRLAVEMLRLFAAPDGGFYFTGTDNESLIARTRETYDGASPAGNSVAALLLLRLGRLTSDSELEAQGASTLKAFSEHLSRGSMHFPYAQMAVDFMLGPTTEIVLAGARGDPELEAMIRVVAKRFDPARVTALCPSGEDAAAAQELFAGKAAPEGQALAHICEGFTCQLPVTTARELAERLDSRTTDTDARTTDTGASLSERPKTERG